MQATPKYRVTGDFMRLVYSRHASEAAAIRAARQLSRKWGWSHPGSEPAVERLADDGWRRVCSFSYGERVD